VKKLFFFLLSILPVVPVLADDLQPAPAEIAVQQYQGFWKTDTPDPMNHVVWKLYIFRAISPSSQPGTAPEFYIAGLTPNPKDSYYVRLEINQLYNWLRPVPQRGDVIVVGGRVLAHRDYHMTSLTKKEVVLKILTMNLDGAVSLPHEHINLSPTPVTPQYGQ
jgi:hypothetical protein